MISQIISYFICTDAAEVDVEEPNGNSAEKGFSIQQNDRLGER